MKASFFALAGAAAVAVVLIAVLAPSAPVRVADFDELSPPVQDYSCGRDAVKTEVVSDPARVGQVLHIRFPANPAGSWSDVRVAPLQGVPQGTGALALWARGTAGARLAVTLWEVGTPTMPWLEQEMFGCALELTADWKRHELPLSAFAIRWSSGGDGKLSLDRVAHVAVTQEDVSQPAALFLDDIEWLRGEFTPAASWGEGDSWSGLAAAIERLKVLEPASSAKIPARVEDQCAWVVRLRGLLKEGTEMRSVGVIVDSNTVVCNKHFIGGVARASAEVYKREMVGRGRMIGGLEWTAKGGLGLAADVAFLELEPAWGKAPLWRSRLSLPEVMPEVFCVQLTAAGEIEFVRGRAVSHEGLLVCDFRSEQGQSGSPVFDADGQLLGIIAGKFRGYPLVVQSIQILKQVQRIRDAQPELDRRNAEFFRAK